MNLLIVYIPVSDYNTVQYSVHEYLPNMTIISSGVAVRGEGSAAGKERLVGESKFHLLGKCTMKPTQIGCPN